MKKNIDILQKNAQIITIRKLKKSINEDVSIPPELSAKYLAVKKQIVDKQSQKDQLMKQVNQKDSELNILQKNLVAIETQAAQIQGQVQTTQPQQTTATQQTPQKQQPAETTESVEESFNISETLEDLLLRKKAIKYHETDPVNPPLGPFENSENDEKRDYTSLSDKEYSQITSSKEYKKAYDDYIGDDKNPTQKTRNNAHKFAIHKVMGLKKFNLKENINEDRGDPEILMFADEDSLEDNQEEIEIDDIIQKEKVDEFEEGDYKFALKIVDSKEDEPIIAKFYKDSDDDYWTVRVVQGAEEPLEFMQFDPDMDKVDIISHLGGMYDEVEDLEMEEYEDLLDDKAEIDAQYFEEKI